MSTTSASQKSFIATWLLSLLLGYFGIDRFYLGKIGTGILKLITFGGFGLWYLIDLIIVLAGAQTDKQSRSLAGYAQHKTVAIIVSILFVLIFGFGGIFGTTHH
jgi:TM2 domain-containing membrane protein YozV